MQLNGSAIYEDLGKQKFVAALFVDTLSNNANSIQLEQSPKRMEVIACETHERDPRCYDCPVFIYCHSDCHQLQWMEDVCPAPKTLMMKLAGDKGWI